MGSIRFTVRSLSDFNTDNDNYQNIEIEKKEWEYSHDYDPAYKISIRGKLLLVTENDNCEIYKFFERGWNYIIIQDYGDTPFRIAKIIHM